MRQTVTVTPFSPNHAVPLMGLTGPVFWRDGTNMAPAPPPCCVYAALSLGAWLADKEGDAPPPGVLEWGSKQEARRRYEPSAPRRGHLPLVEVRAGPGAAPSLAAYSCS